MGSGRVSCSNHPHADKAVNSASASHSRWHHKHRLYEVNLSAAQAQKSVTNPAHVTQLLHSTDDPKLLCGAGKCNNRCATTSPTPHVCWQEAGCHEKAVPMSWASRGACCPIDSTSSSSLGQASMCRPSLIQPKPYNQSSCHTARTQGPPQLHVLCTHSYTPPTPLFAQSSVLLVLCQHNCTHASNLKTYTATHTHSC